MGLLLLEPLEEELGDAGFFDLGRGAELGDGGYEAQGGVFDDFDDGGLRDVGDRLGAGQVRGRDLEAVKDEAGAAGVEVAGGKPAEDFAEACLDGGAVFWQGEIEGAAAGALLGLGGLAGGVVVEAEIFFAEAG